MKNDIRNGALFKGASFSLTKKQKQTLYIKNIVILGDSVAYGYGTKGGIAKYLRETFPGSMINNLGINGLTSNGLIEKLRSGIWDDRIRDADLILLNIGGNDLLRGFRDTGAKGLVRKFSDLKRTYRKNLLETYETIQQLNEGALIVQNNLYNSMKKELQYYGFTNLVLREWNKAIGIKGIIVSKTNAMGKNPSIWLDSIHPNEEGYKLMHELLLNTLTSTGFILQTADNNKNQI